MMNKEQKKNYIIEMKNFFDANDSVLVTHYQGLTVNQLDELRAEMRKHGIMFKITKNRITKLALKDTKCKDIADLFSGPTAVALSKDAISSAKILTQFSKNYYYFTIFSTKISKYFTCAWLKNCYFGARKEQTINIENLWPI